MINTILIGIVCYLVWRLNYSQQAISAATLRKVDGPKKEHWLTGNYHRIFRDAREYILSLHEKYGGAVKINSFLGARLSTQLLVSDPLAIHHIVVKEQDVYTETDMFIIGNLMIFGEGLISTLGEQHRKQRKMLNPVFSLANMRDLLPIIQPIATKLTGILQSQLPSNGTGEINLYPWMIRAAMEYICQAGFGYTFNALEDEDNEYVNAVRNLTPTVARIILYRPFLPFVYRHFSPYWRNKLVDWLPNEGFRDMRRICQIIHETGKRMLAEKKAAFEGKLSSRPLDVDDGDFSDRSRSRMKGDLGEHMKGRDIMSIMLKASQSMSEKDSLSEAELLGQLNTILFAGFETTAINICRILHMLALKPDYQRRLRSEIRATKRKYAESTDSDGQWENVELPYDVLMSMPFLDAVVRETLRNFPPTTVLSRTVRKPAILPLQFPVKSTNGREISAIPLNPDTNIIISLLGANHNKKVWGEDAEEWKPERWLTTSGDIGELGRMDFASFGTAPSSAVGDGTNLKTQEVRYPGVYGSMMTFLGGGRACIGFKFAEMETKQVLVTLLLSLHFSLPSTVDENTGSPKVVRWRTDGIQKPVLRPPAGNDLTPQMPMDLRAVRQEDFSD